MSEQENQKNRLRAMICKIPPSISGACSIQNAVQYKKDVKSAQKVVGMKNPGLQQISSAISTMEKYWR